MNSVTERWIQTYRHELLERTLIWNQRHLRHVLSEYEQFYNFPSAPPRHRQRRPLPLRITDQDQLACLDIHRCRRLVGILNEYHHAS